MTDAVRMPIVVDLDGTLIFGDSLDETFALGIFKRPFATVAAVASNLSGGRARFKAALSEVAPLDGETLAYRPDVLAWLEEQRAAGAEIVLATAANAVIAESVAASLGLFDRVFASDGDRNLKGSRKADVLSAAYPQGFVYVGDSHADLAVWAKASSAVVVGSQAFARRVAQTAAVDRHFETRPPRLKAWIKAARPHQWSKNALVLAPLALGLNQLTWAGIAMAVATVGLFSILSSLTYFINDIADLAADRRHPRKRNRPFASGELRVRSGLLAAGLGIPAVLLAAFLMSPGVAAALAAYLVVTMSYSVWLKRTPILDCFTIGSLFSLRVVAGVMAANLGWSPWLLTFAVSFFFSLALAKRHTELVSRGPAATGPVPGRGYRYEDQSLTLVLGVASFTASIIIIVLYLMEEIFPRGAYADPQWLWVAPAGIFLWVSRIWLLAHRGEMHDDPVIFALKDPVSRMIGATLAAAFFLALL